VVKTPDGQSASVAVPPELSIRANETASLSEIKPGDFVASAADTGPDGKVHAEELRILPEAMRGAGEGHRPMGPNHDRTMTNRTVTVSHPEARTITNGKVRAIGGSAIRSITVKYKEAETVIEIDPNTPITRIVIAERSLLKPGAAASIVAAQKHGALIATNVTSEKDGVKLQ